MGQYYDNFSHGRPANWFKAALKKAPDDVPTRQLVAIWALKNGNFGLFKEQAEAALRIEADRKYSDRSMGRMLRGQVALWEKDWATAELNFQKVVLENPHNLVARNNLALALVEQDDPAKKQRALAYAEANYRDKQNIPEALPTLGWVYFRRGEFDQAKFAFELAINAAGKLTNPDAATYWAHILHHRDRDWEAKAILDEILKNDRSFSMKPEAKTLYEKVRGAKKPAETTPPAKTP
jgi:tetratricopeptide (TPR) repeat protein